MCVCVLKIYMYVCVYAYLYYIYEILLFSYFSFLTVMNVKMNFEDCIHIFKYNSGLIIREIVGALTAVVSTYQLYLRMQK